MDAVAVEVAYGERTPGMKPSPVAVVGKAVTSATDMSAAAAGVFFAQQGDG